MRPPTCAVRRPPAVGSPSAGARPAVGAGLPGHALGQGLPLLPAGAVGLGPAGSTVSRPLGGGGPVGPSPNHPEDDAPLSPR